MLVSRDRISYSNMSPELDDRLTYIAEAGVFGVAFRRPRRAGDQLIA